MTLEQDFVKFRRNFIANMQRSGVILETVMVDKVAQKTRRLERSIKADPPKVNGNEVEVEVGSEGVNYAIIVEKGVKGRVYQYHRLSGGRTRKVVHVGVGMQWAERSLVEAAPQIVSTLKSTRV